MTRLLPALLLTAAAAAGGALLAQGPDPTAPKAADWPRFRGPKSDNVSPDKGLLKQWPKGGPKLLWQSKGVGQGFSSVTVVGDRVFTMGEKSDGAYVFALSRQTGKVEWEQKVGRAGRSGGFAGSRSTPTYSAGLVFALGQHGELACLDAAKGTLKWSKDLRKDYKGNVGGWAYSESVLIDGDALVCTPGGKAATMLALNKKTGEEIWRAPLGDQAGYSSIVISNAGGIKHYVQLTQNGTIGVSAKDGKELWRFTETGRNTANIPTPIVVGDQVFTCAGYYKGGGLLSLSKDGDGVAMKKEYFSDELTNKHGGVVIVGEHVFGDYDDSGSPRCWEWKTGKEVWRKKGQSAGRSSASLTYADGHLYIRYSNGVVVLVPATAAGYAEKGTFKIPNSNSNSWAHPVVIGGRLYLREKDVVYCYDVSAR